MEDYKLGTKVSVITMIINIVLSILKLIAGIIGRSSAMIADSVHSASDVFTTVIVIVGLKISSKKADREHPYGHERLESISAKLISEALILVGLVIGYKSALNLYNGNLVIPGRVALFAALLSIVVKEAMYWYTIITARKIRSISMEGDAWHHRSDAFSSIGTFIGILGARFGYIFLDPLAGIIVSLLIIKVGIDLYKRAVKELIDSAADDEVINKIKNNVLSISRVKEIKNLKTRIFGNKIYVDIEVYVNEELSVREGHDIAELVENSIENEIDTVKHCMVHIEPFFEESKLI
ncbi:cation diffusion facilitator family transporter [Clostridium intestinale]|uniref:Cation diffusion facilitator family transporter n=1 Tax=Clostridium intestinale DSM 6191 TaxID=1121320 RepID=A0A1M5UEP7_9CLOT|nr:cation diffusion facilitator family transporter [Clostridium intestinale]SHH61504.1 cation diffusion facilitator family transporter [Clostridium intestinale DSM 6191]